MKLCSFRAGDKASYGIVSENGIIDLASRFPGAPTLRSFLAAHSQGQLAAHADAAADYTLDQITFDPVIPDPDKIVCVGLNYHDHVAETGRTVTDNPVLFSRYAGSQVGHLQPLIKPLESDMFDYEGELAVIIGKEGRRISEADALSHVAGYACYNEGSVRDWQRHTHQFLPGKTFAGTGGFGPWMVTADEIPDPAALTLTTRLNGEVVQQSKTDLMITPVPALIAYISTMLPLLPGDVIVAGTPGGVGAKRTPPLWMRDGDTAEVEITSIGCLTNPVVAES
jgi:2-keto-4-pentenoate hydratase/2-oxohepta-3-ene-1,7-dioic acid hydratase in catechol pathway